MIINMHSHLFDKNMFSDLFLKAMIKMGAKGLNIPEAVVEEKIVPRLLNADAKTYVKAMEEAGIDKGLVMGVDFGCSPAGEAKWSVEEMNQWVANQVKEFPDKLLALCAVDPRRGKRAIDLVEKAVTEWGMMGVKFHPTAGYYPDDPAYFPLYEKMVELGVSLHSHTSLYSFPLMSGKCSDPVYLDGVAANFPDLKIVMVHFGGMEWISKCISIMNARGNVYAEISGQQSRSKFFPKKLIENFSGILKMSGLLTGAFKDRILFGTDWPLLETAMPGKKYVDWIKNLPEKANEYGLTIKQRDIRKILGDNAQKFLKI